MKYSQLVKLKGNSEMQKFTDKVGYENWFQFDNSFVSDKLVNHYIYWFTNTPIFVKAPTGCGKTFFMEQKIKDNPHLKFLIVSNRIALNSQIKRRMCEKLGARELALMLTDKGIERLEQIKNVTIITYHALAKRSIDRLKECRYTYVLADECHAIFSESSYFARSSLALDKIVALQDSIRIYFSATPERTFNIILEREIEYDRRMFNINNLFLTGQSCRGVFPIYYEFFREQKLYEEIKFFYNLEDLKSVISTSSNEQTLIFVDWIKEGKKIKELIASWGLSVELVTSYSKVDGNEGNLEYQEIIKNESFKNQVLVASKVLETGINLKMQNLKNVIMLTSHSYESFLQCLGRKRILRNTRKINLFVKILTQTDLNEQLRKWEDALSKIQELKENGKQFKANLVESLEISEYEGLFFIENEKICTNPLAEMYLNTQILEYECLKFELKDNPLITALMVLHWLEPGTELTETMIVKGDEPQIIARLKLVELLENYVGIELENKSNEQIKFKHEFASIYNAGFNDEKKEEFGLDLIKKKIIKLKLPYVISNAKRKAWLICKVNEVQDNE